MLDKKSAIVTASMLEVLMCLGLIYDYSWVCSDDRSRNSITIRDKWEGRLLMKYKVEDEDAEA